MRNRLLLAVVTLVALIATLYGAFLVSRSRTWQAFGTIVDRVDTDQPLVALTFDDGPTDLGVDAVLPVLAEHAVPATFFLTGRETAERPELARRIVEAGHELGNHSWSHERMWLATPRWVQEEVERTDEQLRAAGAVGPFLFRAPYCKKGLLLPYFLMRTGRVHLTFDVEPETPPGVADTAEGIVDHVLAEARPGSVVLLHVMYGSRQTSRDALPGIITGLRDRGYRFVTASDLLAAR